MLRREQRFAPVIHRSDRVAEEIRRVLA